MSAINNQPVDWLGFGPFRLNVRERLLLRGQESVLLSPKIFDTLVVLVENCGHIVSKDELLARLWPDSFVEESSLAQNISLLRKALGDVTSQPQYIETIQKNGYRFIADVKDVSEDCSRIVIQQRRRETILVEEEEIPPPSSSTSLIKAGKNHPTFWKILHHPWRGKALALAIICLATVSLRIYLQTRSSNNAAETRAIKSIAIIPFKVIGAKDDQELSGLGMADALIIHLSKLGKPIILPTSTVYKYIDSEKDALSIGRELGVEAVLCGTIQRSRQRVRVTAQLVRVIDSKTLWADKIDEEYRNTFTLQDSISRRLSEMLLIQVGGRNDTLGRRLTQNPDAYQAYLLGLYFWNRGKEDLAKSVLYFERAVEQDPNFALAYSYLADCYYFNAAIKGEVASYEESLKKARSHVSKALSLDETIAEAHTVVAGIKTLEKDYKGAEVEHMLALQLNPNFAIGHNRYGIFLFNRSDLDGAVRELRRGQELDPVSRVTNSALANMLLFDRKYDESIKFSTRAVEIDPSYGPGLLALGESYILKGKHEQATHYLTRIINTSSSETHVELAKSALAISYAESGRRAEAQKLLKELLRSGKKTLPYTFATIYAALGDKDKAFEWLAKEKQTPFRQATLKFDPFLDPLRSDQRFTQLLQRQIQDD